MASRKQIEEFFKDEKTAITSRIVYRKDEVRYYAMKLADNKNELEKLIKEFNNCIKRRKQLESCKYAAEESLKKEELRKEIIDQVEFGYYDFSI